MVTVYMEFVAMGEVSERTCSFYLMLKAFWIVSFNVLLLFLVCCWGCIDLFGELGRTSA